MASVWGPVLITTRQRRDSIPLRGDLLYIIIGVRSSVCKPAKEDVDDIKWVDEILMRGRKAPYVA